jgi:hypothetical protein
VVPTDRMPTDRMPADRRRAAGSQGGSISTSGIFTRASLRRSAADGSRKTERTPDVPRAMTRSSHLVYAVLSLSVVTSTLMPSSSAASTAPRSSSSDQGPCRLPISMSTTPKPAAGMTWCPWSRSSAATRARVAGATSVPPLRTLDTVDTDRPACAAIALSVLCAAISAPFRKARSVDSTT